jgi:hypothetical protein
MTARQLLIAAHAALGVTIAGAVWIGCAAKLAADSGLAGPMVAVVEPFSARAAACPDCARLVAARVAYRLQHRLIRRAAWDRPRW